MAVALAVCAQPVLKPSLPKLPSGRASTHRLCLTIIVTFVINLPLDMPLKLCGNRGHRSIPAWVGVISPPVRSEPINNQSHICHMALVLTRLREQVRYKHLFKYEGTTQLHLGDPIFMRHSKAGELCERFTHLLLVSHGAIVDTVTTYRGDGQCFI